MVLEDNHTTTDQIMLLIREIETKCDAYACFDIKEAYQCALEKDINLFIIDIILNPGKPGDASGLRFADNIRKMEKYAFTPIIFVTSLEDEKLYTYEKLHCFYFLEKPYNPEELKRLVKECLRFPLSGQERKTLYFRKDGIILAVDREDIVYVECYNHTLNIHTNQGDLLCIPYITLKDFLIDVGSADFLQCSRSVVVNKRYIHNVDMVNRVLQLKGRMGSIIIGITYKKKLKEVFR